MTDTNKENLDTALRAAIEAVKDGNAKTAATFAALGQMAQKAAENTAETGNGGDQG